MHARRPYTPCITHSPGIVPESPINGRLTPDELSFTTLQDVLGSIGTDATVMIVGRADGVRACAGNLLKDVAPAAIDAMIASAKPGDAGATATTFNPSGGVVCLGVVPSSASRHNLRWVDTERGTHFTSVADQSPFRGSCVHPHPAPTPTATSTTTSAANAATTTRYYGCPDGLRHAAANPMPFTRWCRQ